jgi:flagellum-specific peptidoglycan hydrolase FlgJ
MTKKIEIPVEARLNTSGVEQGAKKLDDALNRVGKRKIDPVPDSAIRKIDALFQAYLKLDREMARRLKVTGQQGLAPDAINWDPVYQNQKSRSSKMRQLQQFMHGGGADFQPPQQPGAPRGPGGGARMAAGVAQAGLRAAGPAGGVAANALGTGMSAGFGAGLMGLVGGIAALGVGKLVGAVTEKIEQAENNNIAYDRLKRTVGDVGTSFIALKTAVMKTGESLNVTYDETSGLFSQFAKAGKVSGRNGAASMPQEIGLGVGMSRAYGLDNGQGVGFLGQMRGVGVTKDVQDSRRLAILVGETIAKSDAFAKADEVLEAIGNFATSQTRSSMSGANVAGYAGMFSSMVGSGIPGMDPSGAASMLSRVNSSLSAGGAKGEASQFFTSMVGNRMGLDPLQMQVMREGGAFASKDQMFGVGSAYTRYMGQTGPQGSSNYLSETRSLIEEKYGGDSETQKLMRAQAFGNHTGLNMNQSMAMLSLEPNQMGELQKVLGNTALSMNASGINNAAMALNGTDQDRDSIRSGLLKRDDLKKEDRATLESIGSQSPEEQKRTLAILSAQYEQERTQGSDIRDSRAALDNIKVKVADYMVPALQDMRKALLYMAGGNGKKTPGEMMKEFAAGEEKDRVNGINEQFDNKKSKLKSERDGLYDQRRKLRNQLSRGQIPREQFDEQMGGINTRLTGIDGELGDVESDRSTALKPPSATVKKSDGVAPSGGATGSWDAPKSSGGGTDGKKPSGRVAEFVKKYSPLAENIAKEKNVPVDAVLGQLGLETGWGKSIIPGSNNLGNIKDFSGNGPKAKDNMTGSVDAYRSYESTDAFGEDFKKLLDKKRYQGAQGTTNAKDYFSALKRGGYAEDPNYVRSGVAAAAMAAKARGTAIPSGATPLPDGVTPSNAGGGRGMSVSFDPLIVKYPGQDGRQVMPDQAINTRVNPANPMQGGANGAW